MDCAHGSKLRQGLRETYELRIGEETFAASVRDGRVEIHSGAAADPVVTLVARPETLLDVRLGKVDPARAEASGRLTLQGAKVAVRRFRRVFALT